MELVREKVKAARLLIPQSRMKPGYRALAMNHGLKNAERLRATPAFVCAPYQALPHTFAYVIPDAAGESNN
jgi:hypothetical protein